MANRGRPKRGLHHGAPGTTTVTIVFPDDIYKRLSKLAEEDFRSLPDEVRFLVYAEHERRHGTALSPLLTASATVPSSADPGAARLGNCQWCGALITPGVNVGAEPERCSKCAPPRGG